MDANAGLPLTESALKEYARVSKFSNAGNALNPSGARSSELFDSNMAYIIESMAYGFDLDPSRKYISIATSGATEGLCSLIYMIHKSYPNGSFIITEDNHPVIELIMLQYKIHYDIVRGEMKGIREKYDADRTVCIIAPAVASMTGKILPVKQIGSYARKNGLYFICDATQCVGKLPISCKDFNIGAMVFSAHKFGGPRGCGFVIMEDAFKESLGNKCLIPGHQQDEMRGGTIPIELVAASTVALQEAIKNMEAYHLSSVELISEIAEKIMADKSGRIKSIEPTLPQIKAQKDYLGTTILIETGRCTKGPVNELGQKGYLVGTGTACTQSKPSTVIRISAYHKMMEFNVEKFVEALIKALE